MANRSKKKPKTLLFWSLGIMIIVAVAAFVLWDGNNTAVSEQTPNESSAAVAPRVNTARLSATGHVQTAQRATLSFQVPGRVAEAPVRIGDVVQAGDLLMVQETAVLEINLANAQQHLIMQEANLNNLRNGATAAELAAAEAAVASAEAYLTQLQAGPRAEEIAVQNAEMSVYTASTWSASAALNQVNNSNTADQIAAARIELAQTQAILEQARQINKEWKDEETHRALTQAEERVAIAQERLNTLLNGPNEHDQGVAQANLAAAAAQQEAQQFQTDTFLRGGTPEQIAAATAQVAQAQASLDALNRGASDEQIAMAETAVSQAQLDVDAAQTALDKAIIHAPFDGVITAVHATEGTLANGPAIEMVNPDKLEVVLRVSEIDLGQLAEGQTVIVHTETWPTEKLESEVTRISPSPIPGEERVLYEIRLALPESKHPIRVGMTVSADLLTEK